MDEQLAFFEERQIRRIWDGEKEKWYFSVIDIVGILIEQEDIQSIRNYWNVLKHRLKAEWSQTLTNCKWLKMMASDGKMRLTDVADVETIFRLVQSIPSKKAEPIKLRLAKIGHERLQEIVDPAQSVDRARANWQRAGRSEKRIQQRMMGQETRNKLTDYWKEHDIKEGEEFAILTNIIHEEWTGLSVKEHKQLKNLKSQNLRDHMSEAELVFTALAELSTRNIAEQTKSTWLEENKLPAKEGGKIAKDARSALEAKTGESVITGENFLSSNKNGLK